MLGAVPGHFGLFIDRGLPSVTRSPGAPSGAPGRGDTVGSQV